MIKHSKPPASKERSPLGTVVFENVSKVFDDGTKALVKLNLAVQEGEFLVVVGPSGCGKTTALRIVSGLEDATEGLVSIGGRSMEGRGPADRDVAMVFQNYALYPHMTVFENLGFGLRMRKTPKREIGQRVEEISRTLGLTEVLHRKPRALSGGQRQRVAMGRAIVRNPSVFLMDEPLSNLDAGLRVQMRREIARIQRDLGTTTIYVTHDQVEAMTMADRVAVMRKGLLQQVGAPQDVYKYPSNLFVASFIGNPPMNLLRGRIVNEGGRLRCAIDSDCFLPVPDEATGPLMPYSGRMAAVGIRPEHLQLSSNSSFQDEVHLHGRAVLCEALGSETLVHLEVSAVPAITPEILEVKRHLDVTAVATIQAEAEEKLTTIVARLNPDVWVEAGSRLTLRVTPSRLVFFDLDTGYALV